MRARIDAGVSQRAVRRAALVAKNTFQRESAALGDAPGGTVLFIGDDLDSHGVQIRGGVHR